MQNNLSLQITKDDFIKNELFCNHTTFKIGGKIKFYFEPSTLSNLIGAVDFAIKNNLKFKIIGNGSNLLVSDAGFDGLVICTKKLNKIKQVDGGIIAYCGANLSSVINKALSYSLGGIEALYGIPATIGGACIMNAGAFGDKISNFIDSVCVLENGSIKKYYNSQCAFLYRKSIFNYNNFVVLFAKLNLFPVDVSLSKKKIEVYSKLRYDSQPIGFSCGCVFKNPLGYNAGMLIDSLSLKGERVGGAVVSKKHANFILNDKNASANDVLLLIDIIKNKVKKIFNIELINEVEYLGNFDDFKL